VPGIGLEANLSVRSVGCLLSNYRRPSHSCTVVRCFAGPVTSPPAGFCQAHGDRQTHTACERTPVGPSVPLESRQKAAHLSVGPAGARWRHLANPHWGAPSRGMSGHRRETPRPGMSGDTGPVGTLCRAPDGGDVRRVQSRLTRRSAVEAVTAQRPPVVLAFQTKESPPSRSFVFGNGVARRAAGPREAPKRAS
jgi:hypothetical protein